MDRGRSTTTGSVRLRGAPPPPLSVTEDRSLVAILVRTFSTAGVAVAVWLWGYMGFSIAWVYIALFCQIAHNECRKLKTAKKEYARHAALNERAAVQSRVSDQLCWVYFPEVEKVEWLNKIIKQMWPYIGEYVKDLMFNTIEPLIQESLDTYKIKSFKFEKIDIGDVAPRVDGLKLYSVNVKKGEVIFDIDLNYNGDTNIKVHVQGISCGIKTLMLGGTLRVVLKPLISDIPIVGGVSVFFLNKPTVSFDLTNAANLLDMPGLNKSLRSIVEDQVAHYLVLPNRFPIALSPSVTEATLAAMRYPLPEGVIALHVLEAAELISADKNILGKGKSDPYCKITVGACTVKTHYINSDLNPVWNQFFELIVDQKHGQFVVVEVLDRDPGRVDDSLGKATLDIENMAKSGTIDLWMPLENVDSGKIHLQATWLYLSKALHQNRLSGGVGSRESYSSAILIVTLQYATKLPVGSTTRKERNAFTKLTVGKTQEQSTVKPCTCEPQWNENFQFLVDDPDNEQLMIELLHRGSTGSEKRLDGVNIQLNSVLPSDDPVVRVLDLPECGPHAQLSIRLCMRLLSAEPASDAEPISTPISTTLKPIFPPAQPAAASPSAPGVDERMTLPSAARTAPSPPLVPAGVVSAAPDQGLVDRSVLETMRRRKVAAHESSATSESKFGKINLTIRYSGQRGQLVVVIHECKDLIPCDKDNLADPYVRIYVLPDQSSSTRKRTKMLKNTLNPVFDETFEWTMSLADASSRSLDIAVKNDVTLFSKSRTGMGNVVVDLSLIGDLTKATTAWFDLVDPALP